MNRSEVVAYYQSQLAEQQTAIQQCLLKWKSLSYLRGIFFLLSAALLIMGLTSLGDRSALWLSLAGVIFIGFLTVAFIHEGVRSTLTVARMLASMHRESLARLDRRWNEIEVPAVTFPDRLKAVSADLDLFTESSIYKLLGTVRTPSGIETLRDWIIEGTSPDEIGLRQQAVAELKSEFDWRLKFAMRCEQLYNARSGAGGFVQWAESSNWLVKQNWLLWLSRLTGIVSLLAILGLILGLMPLQTGGIVLLVTCGINFLMSVIFAGSLHDIFNQISSEANEAFHFVNLFDRIARYPAQSDKLKSLQSRLSDPTHDASGSMHSLSKRIGLANMRRNGILFIPYLIFEFLFFWDVHCLDLLERWKARKGTFVRDWFAALGEWEALCSLAKLAGDEPDWTFPSVTTAESNSKDVIEARQLAHPLLSERRVANDVQVGPPGTVLLVTGSNMSGKSTLLRAIGLNAVLAQMGSVVCARSMTLPTVRVETSMRIADSLADGVSFFMAELKRLKEVVDLAKTARSDPSRTLLFLLDEILQGTNSRERQIAVSRVVRKLIDENAIGAISTHDLDLATTDELRNACQTVHFSEQFLEQDGKRQMTFDYQMKQGIAETTNALKLLEMVGLGE